MRKYVLICISFLMAIGLVSTRPLVIYADSGFDYTNYYELDYIKPVSSGAFIDTGISITQNLTINMKFNYGDGSNIMFGSNNGYFWGLEGTTYRTPSKLKQGLSFTSGSDYVVSATQSSLSVNGTSQSLNNDSNTGYGNLMIFRYHAANSSNTLKVYYLEVYSSDNTLLAKFVPAMRKSDSVVGMYDTVSGSFKTNSGSSSFEYGSIVSITQYTITTSVSPSGSGTVSGGGTYDSGSVISLVASANNGYQFDSWSDGVTDNPRTITVSSDQSFTAVFTLVSPPSPTQYTITTSVSPSGSGTVSGGGTYDSGSSVTLTATANNGYEFSSWSDGVTTNPRTITVSSDLSFTALFTSVTPSPTQYTITTSVSPSGSGTVTGGGTFNYGDTTTLTAVANNGYQFGSWSDGVTTNPRTIQVSSDLNLTAYFVQDLSNQIVLGTNVRCIVMDDNGYYFVTEWRQVNNQGGQVTYQAGAYNSNFAYQVYSILQLDVVLNNDYYGYLIVNYRLSSDSSDRSTTIYVNGRVATTNIYFTLPATTNISITGYNTSHLALNMSSTNALYDGTFDSNQTNDNFSDSNDDFNSMASDMFQLENGFNQDLNDSLDEIDTDFSFDNAFGSKFLHSASFVKDEFDFLTQNNAFGSLLSFSLLLGLGLLILGKIL